jgi:nitroreductase
MDFMDLAKERKSVRKYSDKEVEDDKIDIILEAARLAPSSANKQCWSYIVVRNKETIAEIATRGTGIFNSWLKKAPVVIVACGNPKESGSRNDMDYYLVDIEISMEHIMLQAADLGLGTCWIGWFDEKEMRRILGIPENLKVVAFTPIGYPADDSGMRTRLTKFFAGSAKRKPLEEIVHKDKW